MKDSTYEAQADSYKYAGMRRWWKVALFEHRLRCDEDHDCAAYLEDVFQDVVKEEDRRG